MEPRLPAASVLVKVNSGKVHYIPINPNSLYLGLKSYCANMQLAFSQKSIREVCESEKKAKKKFGDEIAQQLIRRLADLRAAESVFELVVGNPRRIDGMSDGYMVIDIIEGVFMVFSANHLRMPMQKDGSTNWAKVSRIKISKIGNKDD